MSQDTAWEIRLIVATEAPPVSIRDWPHSGPSAEREAGYRRGLKMHQHFFVKHLGAAETTSTESKAGTGECTVSSFETRPKGTLRFSLHFAWQRGCLVSEWSWQEKRKRALLESNPPGISCRRLIPMSAGEVALVAASPVFWTLGVIGAGLSTSSKPHRDRSPDAFENSTPRAARPVRVLPRSRFAVVRTPPASNSPRPHAVGPGCNSAR